MILKKFVKIRSVIPPFFTYATASDSPPYLIAEKTRAQEFIDVLDAHAHLTEIIITVHTIQNHRFKDKE